MRRFELQLKEKHFPQAVAYGVVFPSNEVVIQKADQVKAICIYSSITDALRDLNSDSTLKLKWIDEFSL